MEAAKSIEEFLNRAKIWIWLVMGIVGAGWWLGMTVSHFATASDMSAISEKVSKHDIILEYLQEDIKFLKEQTVENGRSTRAKILPDPRKHDND